MNAWLRGFPTMSHFPNETFLLTQLRERGHWIGAPGSQEKQIPKTFPNWIYQLPSRNGSEMENSRRGALSEIRSSMGELVPCRRSSVSQGSQQAVPCKSQYTY